MSESLAEALTAWCLMIERRLTRIEEVLRLPPHDLRIEWPPGVPRPDDARP